VVEVAVGTEVFLLPST